MVEAVRLVIWDLDETYWKGTITEGGIQYLEEHHNLVIELAKRGIMSSICSKNDEETVLNILRDKNILDYFIFPSICWEAKGHRIASLIETIQLRAPTVMFLDDNPNNRAEASAIVEGLQVEDETFISKILADPRFVGKNDENLTRLSQYKLLETRKKDEKQSEGNNEQFLRGCDVRVYIEYDVLSHIDRAIELINRTNQLNFTKVRLPEDIEQAREQLRKAVEDHYRPCGLVRVIDKYGDYGFVGFFMLQNGALDTATGKLTQWLNHYCFSCRTLGMLVEYWLYEYLKRPQIRVVGEVLTDLSVPRVVDWIRLVTSLEAENSTNLKVAREIRIHGGCEANTIAHYLKLYADDVIVTGNFFGGISFFRMNGSSLLLSSCDRQGPDFEKEAELLMVPHAMLESNYFRDASEDTVFIFGGQLDYTGTFRYRHKVHGWEIVAEPYGFEAIDLVKMSVDEIALRISELEFGDDVKEQIASVAVHIHNNYETVIFQSSEALPALLREVFSRIPIGAKLILITDHDRMRTNDDKVIDAPWVRSYADIMKPIAALYPYVSVVSFTDQVLSDDEVLVGGNHYDRMVYYRMAEAIAASIRNLPGKTANFEFKSAVHPDWQGTLILNTGTNSVLLMEYGSTGKYQRSENGVIQINWDKFPPEFFKEVNGTYVKIHQSYLSTNILNRS